MCIIFVESWTEEDEGAESIFVDAENMLPEAALAPEHYMAALKYDVSDGIVPRAGDLHCTPTVPRLAGEIIHSTRDGLHCNMARPAAMTRWDGLPRPRLGG